MTGWELIEGIRLEEAIDRQFAEPSVRYRHIHFAAPGCYVPRWSAREQTSPRLQLSRLAQICINSCLPASSGLAIGGEHVGVEA